MPQYRVIAKSFINDRIVEAGELVQFDGLPAENLEPTDDEGAAKVVEAKAARKAQQEALARSLQPLTGVDPAAFAAAVAMAVKEMIGTKGSKARAEEAAPLV